jgi:hypothetical protein
MSCKQIRRSERKAKKEFEQQMTWAQAQRKNYKHGFLTPQQINSLEEFQGWTWITPNYVNFTAYRAFSDGTTEPVTIRKIQPYGLPGNYELALTIETRKNPSIMMIVKNNKIVMHYECTDKCGHKGCPCTTVNGKVVIIDDKYL